MTKDKATDESMQIILAALCMICLYLLMFTARTLDDNRLVNWQWVFAGFSPIYFTMIVITAMAASRAAVSLRAWADHAGMILFCAAILAVLPLWQLPEVIIDASRYFAQAKAFAEHGPLHFFRQWGDTIPAWTDLPLVPAIYGSLFSLFGEHRELVQSFNTILFAATVLLTYLIGRELFDTETGLLAGILLIGMPHLLVQVPLLMTDVTAMFLVTASLYTTLVAIRRNTSGYCILAGTIIALALLTRYGNWLMLTIVPVAALVHNRGNRRTLVKCGAIVTATTVLLVSMFFVTKLDVVSAQLQLIREFQAPALYRWQESWISTLLFQSSPLATIFAIIATMMAMLRRERNTLILLWPVMLILVLELKRARYAGIALPPLSLMAAYGLHVLTNGRVRLFLALTSAFVSVLLTHLAYLPFLGGTSAANILNASVYLERGTEKTVAVHVLPGTISTVNPVVALPMLDLFTENDIVYIQRSEADDPDDIPMLPWRWTWEVDITGAYDQFPDDRNMFDTRIIIKSDRDQVLPEVVIDDLEGYSLQRSYDRTSGVYRYKAIVDIYSRDPTN